MPIFSQMSATMRVLSAALVFLALGSLPSFAQLSEDPVVANVTGTSVEDPFKLHDLEADKDETAAFAPQDVPLGGEAVGDIEALKYAAENGDEVAMWRLGRFYAEDTSVGEVDHLKAYNMFRKLVETARDHSPFSPRAPLIANALNRLGSYYRDGIEGSNITINRKIAWKMFYTAGNFYHDPNALFSLSELCDIPEQKSFHCSRKQGARWLNLAAERGHIDAQARLGHRMFEGEGVKRRPVKGLMWLTVARKRGDVARHAWVFGLHESAFSVATLEQRDRANKLADKWLEKHCGSAEQIC